MPRKDTTKRKPRLRLVTPVKTRPKAPVMVKVELPHGLPDSESANLLTVEVGDTNCSPTAPPARRTQERGGAMKEAKEKEQPQDFSLRMVYASSKIATRNGATEAELLLAVRTGISQAWSEQAVARRKEKTRRRRGLRLITAKKGGRR